MFRKLFTKLKAFSKHLKEERAKMRYLPTYKLAEIIQNDENDYTVVVQLVNKSSFFYAKPEELLADDKMVDLFSQRDIRALTYLGYLGINSPKYKILAKKLAAGTDKFVFAIKKKGDKNIITKTADQIINEKDIIASMHPEDAKTIGYTVATEDVLEEKKQIEELLKGLEEK